MKLWDKYSKNYGPDKYATFVVQKEIFSAAKEVLNGLSPLELKRLLVTPYDECWLELPMSESGKSLGSFAAIISANPKKDHEVDFNMLLLVDLEGDKLYATEYVVTFNYSDDGPVRVGQIPKSNTTTVPNISEMSKELPDILYGLVFKTLTLINSPEVIKSSFVDTSGAPKNKHLKGTGKKVGHTVLSLAKDMREYLRHKDSKTYRDETGQHWVRRHPHLYWAGEGRKQRVIRFVGPYKRGNPEHGEKTPSYVLTA